MKFKEMEKLLKENGWYLYKIVGSHYQYKHDTKPGKVTIPRHQKELKKGTVNSIYKQAQIEKTVIGVEE